MTLAEVFYLFAIILMMCFIVFMVSIILGIVMMYKKLKQMELRAQVKIDQLQQHFTDQKGMAFKALPLMTFIAPFLFNAMKKWRR